MKYNLNLSQFLKLPVAYARVKQTAVASSVTLGNLAVVTHKANRDAEVAQGTGRVTRCTSLADYAAAVANLVAHLPLNQQQSFLPQGGMHNLLSGLFAHNAGAVVYLVAHHNPPRLKTIEVVHQLVLTVLWEG
jgi:hypothetical protein